MRATARERLVLAGSALALAIDFLLVYALLVRTEIGQWWDAAEFGSFQRLPGTYDVVRWVRFAIPALGALVLAVIAVAAFVRRRWRGGLTACLVPPMALLAAEYLKSALPRPYLGAYSYVENTFPSAHMATTTAIAFCAVLAWPFTSRRQTVVFVAAGALLVEAVANVKGYAHRPSDVLGGLLLALVVALAFTALTGASLRTHRARALTVGAT